MSIDIEIKKKLKEFGITRKELADAIGLDKGGERILKDLECGNIRA